VPFALEGQFNTGLLMVIPELAPSKALLNWVAVLLSLTENCAVADKQESSSKDIRQQYRVTALV
jgi:hypothetical protein